MLWRSEMKKLSAAALKRLTLQDFVKIEMLFPFIY